MTHSHCHNIKIILLHLKKYHKVKFYQNILNPPPPPLNFGWGVEHLSTPPDFENFFLGGVGSP